MGRKQPAALSRERLLRHQRHVLLLVTAISSGVLLGMVIAFLVARGNSNNLDGASKASLGIIVLLSLTLLAIGTRFLVMLRAQQPEHLVNVISAIQPSESVGYKAALREAQAEIEQEEIEDAVDALTEPSRDFPSLTHPDQAFHAAAVAKGLTEIFATLGPPPPGLIKRYGNGGSGSDDGVGAGPRGHNA
ncbi:hypothetical protein ACFW5V_31375 [Streptomyces sp. NPDC058762]|uniref:hypothetical protein n=1 Tax=Streptomyces sp. NPDC058762 TaxID=3346629 RepID=UPI0036A898D1